MNVVAPVVAALAVACAGVLLGQRLGLGLGRQATVALARALVQLAALAFVFKLVLATTGLSAAFGVVMLVVATLTSAGRLRPLPRAALIALLAIGLPAALALATLVLSGAFEASTRNLLPLAGIVMGNCMLITSLTGARIADELSARLGEVEGMLALGYTPAAALHALELRAVQRALVPLFDQTKNVGIVTLPGAFVGMMLGGASPIDAAKVQFVVLALLIGAGAGSVVTVVLFVRALVITRDGRVELPPQLRARREQA
jgi:putative ABC transport system permease protein